MTAPIDEGSRSVNLSSLTGVEVGQLITFTSTENMEETDRAAVVKSHSAIITKIEGNVITIDRNFPTNFSVTGYSITAKGYKVGKILLSNMTISGEFDGYFGDIQYAKGFEVRNVKVVNRNRKYQGETPTGGFDPSKTGGTMHGFRVMYSVDTYFENPTFEYLSYGVMPTIGSVGTSMKNTTAIRCRHTSAPTGGSQNFSIDTGNAYECLAGFDSHQMAYDSRFTNCHSYGDEIEVKLRGRIDIVNDCSFSGGLEMKHDSALLSLPNRTKFRKSVRGTIVSKFMNVSYTCTTKISDCLINGELANYNIVDMFTVEDTTLKIRDFTPKTIGSLTSVNFAMWLGFAKQTSIRNLKILGAYEGQDQTSGVVSVNTYRAFRIDRNDRTGVVKLSNIEIDGFDYGMDFPASMSLEKFTFEDIQFKNCVEGIHNAANYKENPTFNRLSFAGCGTNIYEPHRFRYTTRPTNPIKGQRYYDQTLGKPIWYDGASWKDAMGTVV